MHTLESDEDDDGQLVLVPFTTLELAPLESCPSRGELSLPGGIPETSSPDSKPQRFPQEIALRVLSPAHYRVRRLCIVFEPTKRPSQLEVLVATTPSAASRLDPLSQYLSATFEHTGEPIGWPPESVLRWPLPPTEVVLPMPLGSNGDSPSIFFVQLIMHAPHAHPDNSDDKVVFTHLELLGMFQLPSRAIRLRDDEIVPLSKTLDPEGTEPVKDMRQYLAAAGLSPTLIDELMETPEVDAPVLPAPETISDEINAIVPIQRHEVTTHDDNVLASPFDRAMREFVEHHDRQDQLFATIATPRPDNPPLRSLPRSLSIPRLGSCDSNRIEAIATHTFGSFFTQCLTMGATNEVVESLQLAERLMPLMVSAGLAMELVYEGVVAVVVLALTSESHPTIDVLHAALQLIRTVFQDRTSGFRLIESLSTGQINVGLAAVLEPVLERSHCWSLGSKTTVDRELLVTMRLLIAQKRTRSSFLGVLSSLERVRNQDDDHHRPIPTLNRLRMLRWILQRHSDKVTAAERVAVRSFMSSVSNRPMDTKRHALATECLRYLDESVLPKTSDLNAQLLTLRNHLQQNDPLPPTHVALFEAFPLTTAHETALVADLRRYFELHKRPVALYPHTFTAASLEGHTNGEEFRKGNVVFRGHAEARDVSTITTFQDAIERQTRPFEFSASATLETKALTLETSFARFRGTMEPREPANHRTEGIAVSTLNKRDAKDDRALLPPTATATGTLSSSKLSRVVPVVESVGGDSTVPRGGTTDVKPLVEKEAPTAPPLVRRVSTAAPTGAKGLETAPSIVENATAMPLPPTTSPAPKTAPAGKTGKSQDGCVLQ